MQTLVGIWCRRRRRRVRACTRVSSQWQQNIPVIRREINEICKSTTRTSELTLDHGRQLMLECLGLWRESSKHQSHYRHSSAASTVLTSPSSGFRSSLGGSLIVSCDIEKSSFFHPRHVTAVIVINSHIKSFTPALNDNPALCCNIYYREKLKKFHWNEKFLIRRFIGFRCKKKWQFSKGIVWLLLGGKVSRFLVRWKWEEKKCPPMQNYLFFFSSSRDKK